MNANTSGTFTDTLGTTALTVAGAAPSPTTFKYTAPSGGNGTYTMKYTAYTVQTKFGCSGIADYGPINNNLVSEIDLPDGSKYSFTYEQTPGVSGNVTGRLASVTLPTGGTIYYVYTGGSSGNITCSDGSAPGLYRRTPDSPTSWTYTRAAGAGAAYTTTITDPERDSNAPNGNQTLIQFQGIYETQRKIYQGLTSGTLLATTNTCYNAAASPCTTTAVTLPITQRDIYVQPAPGTLVAKHTTKYDSTYGMVTEQDDYDYGSGSPGGLLRKQIVVYNTTLTNGIVSAPQTITTCSPSGTASACNGTGTLLAQTTYTYDQGTPAGTSGTPQHAGITGSRGNATTIAAYVNSSTTLQRTLSYFDTGNVQTSTDVNSAQTTNTYSNSTASCGNSFPTGVNEPLSLTRSFTWNCTGGVMTQLTDENGQLSTTSYSDPDFWRPASAKDQTNATTTFTYNGQASLEASLSVNSGTAAVDTLQTVDGLGRGIVSQVRQSPSSSNFDTVSSSYNATGLPYSTSAPCVALSGASCTTSPFTTTTYDGMYRPLTVTDAGGGTISYAYSQNDVYITLGPATTLPATENPKRRQLEYDGLGRLTSVCEITGGSTLGPAGTCAQNTSQIGYWTKYVYDALGNLTTLTQNAQAAAGSQQTRSYAHDGLSRLTSETNPESGTSTYTYEVSPTCGTTFKGDLAQRQDAVGNITCYTYDGLHRLLSKASSGSYGSVTPWKYFVYDSATVNGTAMVNAKGHLAEAYTCVSPCSSKITDVGLSYTTRGQVSDEYQSSPTSGGYFHENLTYFENGVTKQISALASMPTFTYGVDGEGRVTSISASGTGQNALSSVTYNAASLPTAVNLASGDSDAFNYDSTNRMTQYQSNVNGQNFTGALTWNANGTLQKLVVTDPFNSADNQTCNYSHDDLERIASVNCGASTWQQNFAYDAFGNIQKSVPTGGTGNSFQPTYSSATNRMTNIAGFTPTYDTNGNILNDNATTHTWDAESYESTVNGTSVTYDALGRAIDSGFSTSTFYSPDGRLLVAYKSGVAQRAWLSLPGGGSAVYNESSSGLFEYDHPDHLGSIRLATNPNRTFSYSKAIAPFGEAYAASQINGTDFTGATNFFTLDTYEFPAREYSDQGRWAIPDPAALLSASPAFPQSWNRYAYVMNNPLALIDPSGLGCLDANGDIMLDTEGNETFTDQVACTGGGGTWVDPAPSTSVTVSAGGPDDNGILNDPPPSGINNNTADVLGPTRTSQCPSATRQAVALGVIATSDALSGATEQAILIAQLTGRVAVVGVSASAGAKFGNSTFLPQLGASGAVNFGIAADPKGNIGLAYGARFGGGYGGGFNAGGSLTIATNSTSIFQMTGANVWPQASVSVPVGSGISASVGGNLNGSYTTTFGTGSGTFGTFGGIGKGAVLPLVCPGG